MKIIKNIRLHIDTSQTDKTVVALYDGNTCIHQKVSDQNHHSQVILPLIETCLAEKNCSLKDIATITVSLDSGSYIGRRVGLAIAKTLGVMLHISVNGKPAESTIVIPYEKDLFR